MRDPGNGYAPAMRTLDAPARTRGGAVVLSAAHPEDVDALRALETDPTDEAVLLLLPVDVEPGATVQALWHRLARRRLVVVLRHPAGCRVGALGHGVPAVVPTIARWTAAQDRRGLRLMALEHADRPSAGGPEMHGLVIRGNVEVEPTTEGVTMTIAPDDPFAVPTADPGENPAADPAADPDVEPSAPTDPDGVPELPEPEPLPSPDETGIR